MQKHEVLNLLERFPDLVDNDDLLSDLFQQATVDTPTNEWTAKHAAHPSSPHSVTGKDLAELISRRPH
jgi:hypothetical protein